MSGPGDGEVVGSASLTYYYSVPSETGSCYSTVFKMLFRFDFVFVDFLVLIQIALRNKSKNLSEHFWEWKSPFSPYVQKLRYARTEISVKTSASIGI